MVFTETNKTLKLAGPVIFGEVAQMAFGLIDTAMIGAVSYKHLAAASLVFSVINIPFILGIGITIAVSQLVSMASGQKDKALVSHYLYNGFLLCLAASLIIAVGLEFSKDILFHLGQDRTVAELAVPYMQWMAWAIIPMLLFMALKQFTDGLEFTKTAMVLSISAVPLKIFLNYILIFGHWGFPRLELIGAGWATIIARSLMFVILGIVIFRHHLFRRYIQVARHQWKYSTQTMKDLLYIGLPSSIQLGMESGAFAISGILIGTIGAREQAAHQVAITLASLTFMVSMGLSQAGSIRTSNAFGRKDWNSIKIVGNSTIGLALTYGSLCAIGFIFLRHWLPTLFASDTAVIGITATLLLFAAVFQISDSVQAISAGLLRGIKDVKVPTVYIFLAYWVIGLPLGYLLAFHFEMKARGIWIGFICGLTFSALLLSLRFRAMSKKGKSTDRYDR